MDMKPIEVLHNLENFDEGIFSDYRMPPDEIKVCKEALTKMIPKRATMPPDLEPGVYFYNCPNCNHFVGDVRQLFRFCNNCGQAIDWSSKEVFL